MDYRDTLTFKEDTCHPTNVIEAWMKWDSNDGDFIEKTETITNVKEFFENIWLHYILAYITLPFDFKGDEWNDAAFSHHITENNKVKHIEDVLGDWDLMCYGEDYPCHSCYGLKLKYFDETGHMSLITFDKIYDEFSHMTHEEIAKRINSFNTGEYE